MSVVKSVYSIIKSPLVTEKLTKDAGYRKYGFWVDRDSNKVEIKKAIERIYKVKVDKISSIMVKGKMKRLRSNQAGKTTSWKKAVVTLREGFEIKLT
ncbi:MAG: 50S ribosomal protein L23 [Candidatus Omnitrophica bacterium]|nr:50S ribosomal protein L23 [Candidatus Omnitrophota bacterium]MDD5429160.1 50S ribosomal protein L23 [Candidatus Omnitrophota bacterium]